MNRSFTLLPPDERQETCKQCNRGSLVFIVGVRSIFKLNRGLWPRYTYYFFPISAIFLFIEISWPRASAGEEKKGGGVAFPVDLKNQNCQCQTLLYEKLLYKTKKITAAHIVLTPKTFADALHRCLPNICTVANRMSHKSTGCYDSNQPCYLIVITYPLTMVRIASSTPMPYCGPAKYT